MEDLQARGNAEAITQPIVMDAPAKLIEPCEAFERDLPTQRYISTSGGLYDSFDFGPLGERLIKDKNPSDLAMLRECLAYSDPGYPVRVEGWHLPVRPCDYALLVAVEILNSRYFLFGPGESYELRDQSRRGALKAVFGIDRPIDGVEYDYVDWAGNDVSAEYRYRLGFP